MDHVKSEHGTMGNTKIQLSYLLNPNYIALYALHVLCNIKTAMKNIPTNPFLITGYQGPDYFCDREKETASLMSALKNGRNITLISPRRMGKTGLIKNVFYYIQKENKSAACFYLDIFSTQNLQEFVSLLGRSVLGKLDTLSQSTLKSLFSFFKSCRPVISADEITGMPSVTLDFIPERSEETLKEIFTYLNQSGVECYIAIDEFQQIMEYPEKGVEGLLRSYIQTLLAEGGAHAHRLHDQVLGLETVANAHQVARVVNHFVERILLPVAEAKLLEGVGHRHAVHQTGYLNHLLRADGHGLGFRESATGTLVQVHLFPLLWLHDGEGGGLQNDAGRGRRTDFSYFFVGLEKDRRKGVLVSREAESGAPKRAGEHTAAFWRRRPQTVEKPLLIDGTAPSRDRKDIGTRAQSIVRGERNGIG